MNNNINTLINSLSNLGRIRKADKNNGEYSSTTDNTMSVGTKIFDKRFCITQEMIEDAIEGIKDIIMATKHTHIAIDDIQAYDDNFIYGESYVVTPSCETTPFFYKIVLKCPVQKYSRSKYDSRYIINKPIHCNSIQSLIESDDLSAYIIKRTIENVSGIEVIHKLDYNKGEFILDDNIHIDWQKYFSNGLLLALKTY